MVKAVRHGKFAKTIAVYKRSKQIFQEAVTGDHTLTLTNFGTIEYHVKILAIVM